MLHVHVSVSFAKYGTLTALTIFGHTKKEGIHGAKHSLLSTVD